MKYGNRKTKLGKFTFDSAREAARWSHLRILERAGRISGLRRQVTYELAPSVKFEGARTAKPALRFVADFEYVEAGARVVEDVKSSPTAKLPAFQIKRHLMKHLHGIDIRIIT
ncbi:DUF1064 domain-containing protein [Variovorax sp. RB3P1]|uniref:DUF1064 domain-containing protein n=1 Tax=Variovorax sp. RB3P1 TaxID=3443732 RepID=UPI003F46F54B